MIGMLGASFKNASFQELDTLSHVIPLLAASLMSTPHSNVRGIVTVLTCNRAEIYIDSPEPLEAVTVIQRLLKERTGTLPPTMLLNGDASEHLIKVTSGLDSIIPGEREILGQVRKAFKEAQEEGRCTPRLTRLFEKALNTAKEITSRTKLCEAGRSLIDAGLKLAEKEKQHPEEGVKALIIGTGAYAKVTYAALARKGYENILVYSASGRAGHFTKNHPGEIVAADQLENTLQNVHMVIECSGQGGINWQAALKEANQQHTRQGTRLTLIDLALNQTASEAAQHHESLHTISMKTILLNTPHDHQKEVDRAYQMIKAAAMELQQGETSREASQVIKQLRNHVDELIAETLQKLGTGSPENQQLVEEALHKFAGALLHTPVMQAKAHAANGQMKEYVKAAGMLLGMEPDERIVEIPREEAIQTRMATPSG